MLATLEFLAASGLKPTVTALQCGHSYLTTSGNVSEHSTGNAVDIAAINGIPILGHQGPGSITDITIRRLLTLQGTMKPHQIISLMTFDGADNTLALPDHYDHIHVGFQPLYGTNPKLGKQLNSVLKPEPVDQAHRPPRQDRQPDGADQAVEVRAQGRRKRASKRPRRRVPPLFGFVQLEFPWALGPPDGRYVVRGHAGELEHVLVVCRRWARPSAGGCAAAGARPASAGARSGRHRARDARHRRSPSTTTRQPRAGCAPPARTRSQAAVATLNRVLHMHRAATADPHVRELRREQALVVRVGYGEGEQVADGRWVKALELPHADAHGRVATRRCARRSASAALLGGRDAALACEELALRARQDVDAGRRREAALQLDAALTAALARARAVVLARRHRSAAGRAARAARRRAGRGARGAAGRRRGRRRGRRPPRPRAPRGRAAGAHGPRFRLTVQPPAADLAVRAGAARRSPA